MSDAGYGVTVTFRQGLTDRGLEDLVKVSHTISVSTSENHPETIHSVSGRTGLGAQLSGNVAGLRRGRACWAQTTTPLRITGCPRGPLIHR